MSKDHASKEVKKFLKAYPDTQHVDALLLELSGNMYGKRCPIDDLDKLFSDGIRICAAMHLMDVQGVCWDTKGFGFSDGDPDHLCQVVEGSLALVPWADSPRAQCLMRFVDTGEGDATEYEPRRVLENVIARFTDIGLTPVAAIELEFYLLDQERTMDGAPQPPCSLVSGQREVAGNVMNMASLDAFGPVIDTIEANCRLQGLPVSTLSKEYGPGQFEINLRHQADAVAAADHAALLRRAVVGTARSLGFDATFMSKPFMPEAGSGLQINLSFIDGDGRNVLDADHEGGAALMGNAIAGMQAAYAESLAIFAPNLHAYRRFEPNQFTPVTLDWGDNNRSVAFRVPASTGADARIEHRAAGAEANPYLAMAAVLAAAHHGIDNKLEPTAIGVGNMGEHRDVSLPTTLWEALHRFQSGTILRDYLGGDYLEAYAHVKQSEFDSFMSEILPREYQWYL